MSRDLFLSAYLAMRLMENIKKVYAGQPQHFLMSPFIYQVPGSASHVYKTSCTMPLLVSDILSSGFDQWLKLYVSPRTSVISYAVQGLHRSNSPQAIA